MAGNETFEQISKRLTQANDPLTGVMELIDEQSRGVRYSQILKDMKPAAVIAVQGEELSVRVLDVIACMIGPLIPPFAAPGVRNAFHIPR